MLERWKKSRRETLTKFGDDIMQAKTRSDGTPITTD
jgi:hypothetical protein